MTRKPKLALLVLLFSTSLFAQNKTDITLATINIGMGVVDSAQSCRPNRVERMLPTQSCAGITAFVMGGKALETGAQIWAVKHNHKKLSKFIPMVGIGATGYALGYSFSH